MFLPISAEELSERGIDIPDFVVVTGEAYVDHPSFGHALIARFLEAEGFSVAIITQPQTDADFLRFGEPKTAFLVASGVVDSMVNNYTVSKQRRKEDVYSEGGKSGLRPDRATTVYSRALKRLFPSATVIIGGLEASLRRFSHYDYWSDSCMPSVLLDSGADLLIYGMGEQPLAEISKAAHRNIPLRKLKDIKGSAYLTDIAGMPARVAATLDGKNNDFVVISSHERVASDKKLYLKAYLAAAEAGKRGIIQKQDYTRYVVCNPPPDPPDIAAMDRIYALPFERKAHPIYKNNVPALLEVEFSITAHRGCFGSCSFCALTFHQGKAIAKRSNESIVSEAESLTESPDFKGYISDIGGPTANFHNSACASGGCNRRECIGKSVCPNLKADHSEYLDILRAVRGLPKVKKVFIRSGVRFDYLMLDPNPEFFEELVKYHVSGQLKVAPEHVSDTVLAKMNKPPFKVYSAFSRKFKALNQKFGLNQFLVPYFISSHPGCTIGDAVALYEYLVSIKYMPLQVQDFYPTPGTPATTMYYTGMDLDGNPLYVARTEEEKAMQRALLQYRLPQNRRLIIKAFERAGRRDLIAAFDRAATNRSRSVPDKNNNLAKPLQKTSKLPRKSSK